jgi:hypothetical protein
MLANVRHGDYTAKWTGSGLPTTHPRLGLGNSVVRAFLVNLTAAANFLLARDPGPIHFLREVISSLGNSWFCRTPAIRAGFPPPTIGRQHRRYRRVVY